MRPTQIMPIVEGHGEIRALPQLLGRMARENDPAVRLDVLSPLRVKRQSFLQDRDYFCRYLEEAALKIRRRGGLILILLDADDDCPAELGAQLAARARAEWPSLAIEVVLANREFEAWFIASCQSLAGVEEFQPQEEDGLNPESPRDAKKWMSSRMPRRYDPVIHQEIFCSTMSLAEARQAPSFRRFHNKVRAWLNLS